MNQKRNIFEDVGSAGPSLEKPPIIGGIGRGSGNTARRGVRLWLMLLFTLVAAMVVLGGLTRLTDSGLSITEWNLVSGTLPPLNLADWQAAFAAYQASPEYLLQNSGMELASFKQIYWWEWGHRLLGRIVGLVWAVGFIGFLVTKRLPKGWHLRLLSIGILGGLQGFIGWWMVSSGLEAGMVDVASYRLATHLGLAFILLGLIAWFSFTLGQTEAERLQARRGREGGLFTLAAVVLGLAFVQILLGALVAGIDAGRSFVDWPWMAGQVFPPDAFTLIPGWRNFFENAGLVQFMHRLGGYGIGILVLIMWLKSRKSPNSASRNAVSVLAGVVLVQMLFGIFTVLYAAPLHLAITHQIWAIFVWVLILKARHQTGYPVAQSIRN